MCSTPVTHLVVKFPTPGESEEVKCPVVSRGGGGNWGLQLIGALCTVIQLYFGADFISVILVQAFLPKLNLYLNFSSGLKNAAA